MADSVGVGAVLRPYLPKRIAVKISKLMASKDMKKDKKYANFSPFPLFSSSSISFSPAMFASVNAGTGLLHVPFDEEETNILVKTVGDQHLNETLFRSCRLPGRVLHDCKAYWHDLHNEGGQHEQIIRFS
jgi:hypothetical protein